MEILCTGLRKDSVGMSGDVEERMQGIVKGRVAIEAVGEVVRKAGERWTEPLGGVQGKGDRGR